MRWAATREPLEHAVRLTGKASLAALREIGRRGEVVTGWA
jgi:hypothetical protein